MVQPIKSFEEVAGKTATFRCSDFEGYIAPSADIEETGIPSVG